MKITKEDLLNSEFLKQFNVLFLHVCQRFGYAFVRGFGGTMCSVWHQTKPSCV
jgi:hypothetical protein